MPDSLPALEAERARILRQITALGDLRPGSICAVSRRCGKPTCHCAKPNDPGHDPQVRLSRTLHDYPRAGDSGEGLTVVEGVQTIDASVIDTSLLGHSYFADAVRMVQDLVRVLAQRMQPDQRALKTAQKAGLRYWVIGVSGGEGGP